jgi:hypothetical protein
MGGDWPALWVLAGSLLALGLLQGLLGGTRGTRKGRRRSGWGHGSGHYPGWRAYGRRRGAAGLDPYLSAGHPGMFGTMWRYFFGRKGRG